MFYQISYSHIQQDLKKEEYKQVNAVKKEELM